MRTRAAYHVFSHLILLLALSAAERTPSASPALRAGNLRLLAHNNPSPTSVPSLTPAPSPVPVTPVVNGATFTALSALYSATNGDGWSDKDNWMSGDPCTNSWSGITCRNVVEGTKTIGQLQRYGNNLVGSLPTELGDLTGLVQNLHIYSNDFTGTIPTELGRLTCFIKSFQLNNNEFLGGTIPTELGNLPLKETFNVRSDKEITGAIPTELGRLTEMTSTLTLWNNKLAAPVPSELGLLTLIQSTFRLDTNKLSGSLPSELGSLSLLTSRLSLYQNELQGIPTELGNLATLEQYLYLYDNSITGSLPTEMGRLAAFSDFWMIHGNSFDGVLPSELGQLLNLGDQFTCYSNRFTGLLPSQLGQLTSFSSNFELNSNSFSNTLPSELGNLNQLYNSLFLNENLFSNAMPTQMGRVTSLLAFLDLSSNLLTASLPSEIGHLTQLTEGFDVASNSFTASLPSELGQLTLLTEAFDVSSNSFSASLPTEFGRITGLLGSVAAQSNGWCGTIPTQIMSLSSQVTSGSWDLTTGTDIGTPCCEVLPSMFTCAPSLLPTPQPSVSGAPSPLPTTEPSTLPTSGPSAVPTPSPTPVCTAGTYLDGDTWRCLNCTAGKATGAAGGVGESSCEVCAFGRFAAHPGSKDCALCPNGIGKEPTLPRVSLSQPPFADLADYGIAASGTYNDDLATSAVNHDASSDCKTCPSGTKSTASRFSCESCSAGERVSADSTTCVSCEKGRFAPIALTGSCLNCSLGYFSDSVGSSSCTACDAGKIAASVGSTACSMCANGSYTSSSGSYRCEECEEGFFQPAQGATTCLKCSTDGGGVGYDSSDGAISCDLCTDGYFSHGNECHECPEAAACPAGTSLASIELDEGYWRSSISSLVISPCPGLSAACKGGQAMNGSVNSYCTEYGFGPFCSLCKQKYYRTVATEQCGACPNQERFFERLPIQTYVAGGIVILLLMGFLTHMCRKGFTKDMKSMDEMQGLYDHVKSKFKIAATTMQIVSQFPTNFDINFPTPLPEFVESLNILNVDLFTMIPTACLYDQRKNNYYRQLFITTAVPIAVLVLMMIYFIFNNCCVAKTQKQRQKLRVDCMTAALIFSFTIFVSTSSCVLRYFAIDRLDDGSCFLRFASHCRIRFPALSSFLGRATLPSRYDYGTRCDRKLYDTWRIYAILMIAAWPIGVPLSYFVLLFRSRKDIDPIIDPACGTRGRMQKGMEGVLTAIAIRDQNEDVHHLHFICASYEPEFWWWEVFECFRRLLLTSANVFIAGVGVMPQIIINQAIALFSVKFYSYFSPFVEDSDDMIAETSQWVLVSSLMLTVLFYHNIGNENGTQWAGLTFLSLQLVFLLVATYLTCRDMSQELAFIKDKKRKAKEKWRKTRRYSSRVGVPDLSDQMGYMKKNPILINRHVVTIQALARGYTARRLMSSENPEYELRIRRAAYQGMQEVTAEYEDDSFQVTCNPEQLWEVTL